MTLALAFVLGETALPTAAQDPPRGGDLRPQAFQGKTPAAVEQAQKDQQQEIPVPLPKGKKLYLTNGNFHIVRTYERKGDRVRYYSVERSAWEEIPADMVDWEATRKSEAEETQRQQQLVEKMRATEAAERTADLDVDASIELAPGVFLPDNEGLYVVEGRTVVPLEQAPADLKLDKKRLLAQVLVPIPVVPTRHKVQLAGKRATLRLNTAQPEFYFRTAEAREPEMELIRARVKGDARLLELLSTQITGEQTARRQAISIERWKAARGVYRFTLSQPLEHGEYALAEILPEGMNLYVWDFGVDPSAARPGPKQLQPGQAPQTPLPPTKQNPPGQARQKP